MSHVPPSQSHSHSHHNNHVTTAINPNITNSTTTNSNIAINNYTNDNINTNFYQRNNSFINNTATQYSHIRNRNSSGATIKNNGLNNNYQYRKNTGILFDQQYIHLQFGFYLFYILGNYNYRTIFTFLRILKKKTKINNLNEC